MPPTNGITPEDLDDMTDEELADLTFISLDGERLTILRGAIDEKIIRGGTERIRERQLPPLSFQGGVFPPAGEKFGHGPTDIDVDVAQELMTRRDYGRRYVLQQHLISRSDADDAETSTDVPAGHVKTDSGDVVPVEEFLAQQSADAETAENTAEQPATNGDGAPEGTTDAPDAAPSLTPLEDEYVSTKQDAVQCLADAGIDVSGIGSIANTTKTELLEIAADADYYFPNYGSGEYAPE